ncbi:MAG: SEL1-like repeat protein [Verrucomicrobia bacterium]|nr:SEL1-like repeat protein [Verrucomicrobiota bacterium]
MVPAPPPSSSQPFPPHLKSHHPNPQTPWNFSEPLFKRVQNYTSDKSFKLCEVLNTDAELNFILKYFEHQKPPGYSIKRVVCIHNPEHTQMFESTLKNMEREASNPVFAPKGKDEEPKADRARVLSRWEFQISQFSPVEIKSLSSRGNDTCTKAKVLPLWHGSTKEICQSICWSGFTSFGKHHYFDENASKGNTKSTDKGYFGAGIYFTNSAQYATMYSSGGHLLLVWVSMREPYPVVNDKPHPQKGSDMLKLEGRMHYQNYNAHFIPVASIRPQDPKCLEYYPCYKDQQPAWDEFVVFEKAQALPRFWIELGTDFPKVVLSDIGTVGELLTLLLTLLNKPEVQQHPDLVQKFQAKADLMRDQAETNPLGVEDQSFLKLAKRLLPEGEKLNAATVNMLIRAGSTPPRSPLLAAAAKAPIPSAAAAVKTPAPSFSVASLVPALPPVPGAVSAVPKAFANPLLPAIAFGKELWAKYLGDVGEEPPLPSDIAKILQGPCPFNPGRRVEETHLLTLIPKTVNGKPLTLNFLEELVKHPRKGSATRYRYYLNEIKNEHGNTTSASSYWVLFTKDVIPEGQNKSYNTQVQLLKEQSQKAKVVYEVPQLLEAVTSILMEYLRTGKRLYSDNPWTFTRCQELVSTRPTWSLVVGGFAADGLIVRELDFSGLGGVRKFNDQGMTQDYIEETIATVIANMQLKAGATSTVIPTNAARVKTSPLPSLEATSLEVFSRFKKAAEQGDAQAQYSLGLCYANGQGVAQDYKEAVKWYHKAAEQGYAYAQHNLGVCYGNGQGVAKDHQEAAKWFQKAAEKGNATAQYNLGLCYANDRGVAKDYKKAAEWYRKAADQGHAAAQSNLGVCYDNGRGVANDEKEAAKWYQKAADQGLAKAQHNLGVCYEKGRGVDKDEKEAVKWYRKAADQGHAAAQFVLGVCYADGQGVDKDLKQAVKWYQKAADQGGADAQFALGVCYEKGRGVDKDEKEAAKWYQKAADQGDADAQFALGVCYEKGRGVDKDEKEAAKWYQKAADQGDAYAQFNLGNCYANGQGVVKDEKEAVKWYQKAADQGLAKAQVNLGVCYENGRGVAKDEKEAVKWIQKAAAQGNQQAQEALSKLKTSV